MKRRLLWLGIVALAGAGAWFGWLRTHPALLENPVDLAKHDGQTIDFSSGKPVVKDSPEDKAALDAAAKDLAEASKGVTFDPPKKKPEPTPAPPKS